MPGERSRGSIRAVGPRSVVVELPGSGRSGERTVVLSPGHGEAWCGDPARGRLRQAVSSSIRCRKPGISAVRRRSRRQAARVPRRRRRQRPSRRRQAPRRGTRGSPRGARAGRGRPAKLFFGGLRAVARDPAPGRHAGRAGPACSLLRITSTAASRRGFQVAADQSDRQPARSLAITSRGPAARSGSSSSGGIASRKRASSDRRNSPSSRSGATAMRIGVAHVVATRLRGETDRHHPEPGSVSGVKPTIY